MWRILFVLLFTCYIVPAKGQLQIFAELKGSPLNLDGWEIKGDAEVVDTQGDADQNNDELLLSKAENNTFGTCFYESSLKLAVCKKWTVDFSFRIFDGNVADGLAFCFVKEKPTGQEAGGNIAIPDNPTGIMIVLDTYNNNCSTIDNPELQIRYGDGTENYNECNPGPTLGGLDFIRSNTYNEAKIEYENGLIKVFINDILRLEGQYEAEFEGYFGFTSATGALNDNHSIKDVSIYAESNELQESVAQTLCEGETLVLDAGDGFAEYEWGDGSKGQFLEINAAGTYNVKAKNICNIVVKKFDIKLQPKPVVGLGEDSLFCGKGTIVLESDDKFETYLWDDGTTGANRVVNRSGIYWLEVADFLGCKGTDSIEIIFSELPAVNITGDSILCEDNTITLDAQPGFVDYIWSNGQTTQTTIISVPGIYSVKVKNELGCEGSDDINVQFSLGDTPFLGEDTAVCKLTNIKLSPAGNFKSYLWQDGSTEAFFNANIDGIYWVKTTDLFGCSLTDSIKIDLYDLPIVDLGNDTSICTGDNIKLEPSGEFKNYLWNDGSVNSYLSVYNEGLFWVEVKDENGCNNKDSIFIVVEELPVVDLGEDISICDGEMGIVKAQPGFKTYEWNTGSNNSQIEVDKAGNYWVKVESNAGCKNSDTIDIIVNPNPEISLGLDTFLCDNNSITIGSKKQFESYLWHNGSTNKEITVENGGVVWLKVWNDKGCSQVDSLIINALNTPVIDLGNDSSICLDRRIVLDATFPEANYLWNNGSTSPVHVVTNSGIYSVIIKNQCGMTSDRVIIKKDFSCDCPIYFPNVFTPNSDGLNDEFKIDFSCEMNNYKLRIYNRWGEQIFYTEDPNEGWTGAGKSKLSQQGIFIWNVTGTMYNIDGKYFTIKKTGTVAILK